jgi:hypothetical protein
LITCEINESCAVRPRSLKGLSRPGWMQVCACNTSSTNSHEAILYRNYSCNSEKEIKKYEINFFALAREHWYICVYLNTKTSACNYRYYNLFRISMRWQETAYSKNYSRLHSVEFSLRVEIWIEKRCTNIESIWLVWTIKWSLLNVLGISPRGVIFRYSDYNIFCEKRRIFI